VKLDGGMMGTVRKTISWTPSHSPTSVIRGELLMIKVGSPHYNYELRRDPAVCLHCDDGSVAFLSKEEFLLLEGISVPRERLDAFNNKLLRGVELNTGYVVHVALPEAPPALAVVRYKGEIEGLSGTHFGVEFLVITSMHIYICMLGFFFNLAL
jgi:hypothetical protein